ncbi:MAG: hypothetical protein Alpg2KO_12560 [Alphaproteobacteria bacterium]
MSIIDALKLKPVRYVVAAIIGLGLLVVAMTPTIHVLDGDTLIYEGWVLRSLDEKNELGFWKMMREVDVFGVKAPIYNAKSEAGDRIPDQPYGRQAYEKLVSLADDRSLSCSASVRPKHRTRTPHFRCDHARGKGDNIGFHMSKIGVELIKSGLAWATTPYHMDYQVQACLARKGIWSSGPMAIYPDHWLEDQEKAVASRCDELVVDEECIFLNINHNKSLDCSRRRPIWRKLED